MQAKLANFWGKTCLILFFALLGLQLAMAHDAKTQKEITNAIDNAKNGEYQQAIPVLKKYADAKGFNDLTTLQINVYLNWCYLATEKEALNVDAINKSTDSYLEKYGISKTDSLKSVEEMTVLFMVGTMNSSIGNNEKMVDYFLKIYTYHEIQHRPIDPGFSDALFLLTKRFYDLEDFKTTCQLGQIAWKSNLNIRGEMNHSSLVILEILFTSYYNANLTEKSLEYLQKYVDIGKTILGEKDSAYISNMNILALMYHNLGNEIKSLEFYLRVVALRKEALGENHPDYLISLNNLAGAYYGIGNYKKALEINIFLSKKEKAIFGENDPSYLTCLNNLALNYKNLGNYKQALAIYTEIVEKWKRIKGERSPEYLTSMNNLATIYSDIGNYDESLKICLSVVAISKEILGEKHPDYIRNLGNLAVAYSITGNNERAFDLCLQVLELSKEVLGENHPDYLLRLDNLSVLEFHLAKTDSALFHSQKMIQTIRKEVMEYFNLMTENQRELFWKQYSGDFSLFPMFFEKTTNDKPEATGDAYNIALFTKGLLLNTSIDFNQLIAEKGSSEAKAKFEELKLLRLQIQKLNEKPIAERYLNVDSLENIAQQKETELVKVSKEYGDYTRNLKINWQDVQANLKNNDVAIEFVEYPTLTDTVKYAALVLRKGWQYPQMISLFRKDQIDEFIRQDKNKIYSNGFVGKQIRQLVWEPLEKVVSPSERVYFSPAGIYHQLAIENLAASDSTTLEDIYQMYRLSSTKELVTQTAKSKYKSAVLYGGLQYDLDSVKMVAESKKYSKGDNLLAFRGYSNDTTVRKGWEYLGGTLQEVEQINRLMNDRQYLVTEYTGETGNEESFKALSGKSPEIIHIATHGFFQPVEESGKNPFMQMRMGDQQESGGVDPMLRSGLMLAGGNKAWQGEKIPESIEDGVLTAREIRRMDLRGTDLVVLSACETGLGEVSGEGVFGLQRSFKQAGVKNLIMSLWEVSDQSTSFMMKEFYTNLLSGEDLRKAFVDARQKCKQQFPEPQYWAAFVLLN